LAFEIHAENYMGRRRPPPLRSLRALSEKIRPVGSTGFVGLSIGGEKLPLDRGPSGPSEKAV